MSSGDLFAVSEKLEAIELELKQSQSTLKSASPFVKGAWIPIARAASKARSVLEEVSQVRLPARAGRELVPYSARRPGIEAALIATQELWDETKAFLRYSPRDVESPESHAPHTIKRVKSVRTKVASERRWLVKFLGPDVAHEAMTPRIPRDALSPRRLRTDDREVSFVDRAESADHDVLRYSNRASVPPQESPVILAPDYLRTRRYRVFFGTSRTYDGSRFTNAAASALTLGSCTVYVPKTHLFGSTGSTWFGRLLLAVRRKEDDRLLVESKTLLPRAEFAQCVVEEMTKWSRRAALVVVHGYNVDFEEAARRTAQIGFDLRVDGITAFFSWPSKGRLLPYTHDEEAVQEAEPFFIEFIQLLMSVADISEVNILAHSMGNRLLLRTIDHLVALKGEGRLPVSVGHIILAAADLPRRVFLNHVEQYKRIAERRVTSYSCTKDLPLRVSRILHGRDRVGLEPPTFITAGVESISAGDLDLHGLGHGYYAETEALLYDLNELIHEDTHPNLRMRLEPCSSSDGAYWTFRR